MRQLAILCAFGLALAIPLSAQKAATPPGSATFSVNGCVDRNSGEVSVTATWSHARVDAIQFSAFGFGSFLGSITDSGGGSRDGSVTKSWVPQGSTSTRIADEIEVTFTDLKDRWTVTGHVSDIGPC
jgi:hypothetical protein